MDNISGLADRSHAFASFLAVTRKSHCRCIYNFYLFYPEKANWKLRLSHIQMFNLFPAYVDVPSAMNISFGNCTRITIRYIPKIVVA